MIFRIRFEQRGGHVHCRLFQALAPGQTWQKNGEIVFDEPGWRAFAALMNGRIEMVPEENAVGGHMVPHDDGTLLNQDDVSALLNNEVSTATLEKWRVQGKGPRFIRAGRKIFYRRRDVEAWLTRHTITHTHETDP